MEVKDIVELPNSPALSVAVAVKGNKKSRYAVLWALEKFIPEGINLFKLLHVRPRITSVPTASKQIPLVIKSSFNFNQFFQLVSCMHINTGS